MELISAEIAIGKTEKQKAELYGRMLELMREEVTRKINIAILRAQTSAWVSWLGCESEFEYILKPAFGDKAIVKQIANELVELGYKVKVHRDRWLDTYKIDISWRSER